MTVKELMAAFKATRGSLSTRRLARHREAAKNDPRTNAARTGLAEQGVSTHVVYVDSVKQPPWHDMRTAEEVAEDNRRAASNTSVPPTAVTSDSAAKSVEAARALQKRRERENAEAAKPARTRKPTPCSCQCRRADARRAADGRLLNGCNPGRPCGHKGCGLLGTN